MILMFYIKVLLVFTTLCLYCATFKLTPLAYGLLW